MRDRRESARLQAALRPIPQRPDPLAAGGVERHEAAPQRARPFGRSHDRDVAIRGERLADRGGFALSEQPWCTQHALCAHRDTTQVIARGIGQRECNHIPRPVNAHAKRGIGRQIRREVLWRTTFRGHTHEMPEFVAALVVVIIYGAPVRRDPSK